MTENSTSNGMSSVLETAWQRFAELDANAITAQKWHLTMRLWVIILSVVATLLAIVTQWVVATQTEEATAARVLNFILISVPIIGSVILAFANKLRLGERWLALRAGAEEIRKEIFFYRTIWQGVSPEIARKDLLRIWQPNPVWQRFLDDSLAEYGLQA